MVQCTASPRALSAEATLMQVVSTTTRTAERLAKRPPPELSSDAKKRLRWLDHYATHRNVAFTCRHFGISRQTFYKWKSRYAPTNLRTLESRSSRPQRTRPRTWTDEEVQAVQRLREQYPRWGKDKLQIVLARDGLALSVSRVGRILRSLRDRGQLVEPPRALKVRPARRRRPYAVRKPKDYVVQAPGDLVQIDTLDVRPRPGHVLKHFTAVDVISRYSALDLASVATAATAARLLEQLDERLPFPIRALQVDGGSEFMAEFEQACQARNLQLFVLPPRCPKLNGHVERSQRTHTEEFYQCSTAPLTVAALGAALRIWETTYNTIRPHQALGYLPPKQFWEAYQHDSAAALAALPQNRRARTPAKEAVSTTY
jgi:transposase InsO family protein